MRVCHPRLSGFAVLSLLVTTPAFSAALRQMSIGEMTDAATEIVQGTVQSSYVEQSGRTIFTHYTIQVAERWKGTPSDTADVAVPGGLLKGMRQSFPGVPSLLAGHQYLLFLWKGSSGPTQLIGLNQGEFEVTPGGDGLTTASRAVIPEMLLDGKGRQVSDHPVQIHLAEMRSRIRAALGKAGAR